MWACHWCIVAADDVLVSLKPKDEEGIHYHLPKPRTALDELPALAKDLAVRTVHGLKSSTHDNYMKSVKLNLPRPSEVLSVEHIREIKLEKNKEAEKSKHQEKEKKERKRKSRRLGRRDDNGNTTISPGGAYKSDVSRHHRNKRMVGQPDSAWPLGIIPYYFEVDYPTERQEEAEFLMQFFTQFTPVRFVPYEGPQTNDAYGLGHYGRVKFIIDNGCYSNLGYKPPQPDRELVISCVNCGHVCLHELGHVVGFYHEHQNPAREDNERINYEEIDTTQIKISSNYDLKYDKQTFGYLDMDSIMHYPDRGFAKNGRTVIYKFDEDHLAADIYSMDISSHFYMSQETNYFYGSVVSPDRSCTGSTTVCENTGFLEYQSLYGGCRCRCVFGLNPETNCATILRSDPSTGPFSWPDGDYGMLAPKGGCPGSTGSFLTGSSHVNSDYEYLSADWDASGMEPRWPGALDLEFCMRNAGVPSTTIWEPGMYCIFKGTSCPSGFIDGALYFNDMDNEAAASGHVPSGYFQGDHVRLDTCCREDAYFTNPIRMPKDKPFILLPRYLECQEVEGMRATLEYVWYNNIVAGYEATGAHPFIYSSGTYIRVEICYYSPISYDDCGGIYQLDDITPSLNIQTPNYPSNYPIDAQCVWYIKTPGTGDKLRLNFDHFDIAETSAGEADDYVEIRNDLPGNHGVSYYGNGVKRTFLSHRNTLVVYLFSNDANTKSGFSATIDIVKADDMCYTGKGEAYDGARSYTRYRKPCIDWRDAQHCPHHPFQDEDIYDSLDGNYCRNPGNGEMPWCYYDAENCLREYCDVCDIENCYDSYLDCEEIDPKVQFCQKHGQECRKTCGFCDECWTGAANTYKGRVWITDQDMACQYWTADYPTYIDDDLHPDMFPDVAMETANNFCRDPYGYGLTGCFTASGYQNCSIPECNADGTAPSVCSQDVAADCETRWNALPNLCDVPGNDVICATTCGLCAGATATGAVTCSRPTTPDVSISVDKDTYSDGESVTLTCRHDPSLSAHQTCSSTGNWIPEIQAVCDALLDCPTGSLRVDEAGGIFRCYQYSAVRETYADAAATCAGMGGSVIQEADVQATSEVDAVIQALGGGVETWLDLTDMVQSGHFIWGDGSTLAYSKWASSEPDSKDPACYYARFPRYYSGDLSTSYTNTPCLDWQSVASAGLSDADFPMDGGVAAAGNKCRDPTNSGYLWCYVDDGVGDTTWEECDIYMCKDTDILPWPVGDFGVIKTLDGCPMGTSGSMSMKAYSFTSNSIYIDSPWSAAPLVENPGRYMNNEDFIGHEYCIRVDNSVEPGPSFGGGGQGYCVLKKMGALCPTGLSSGLAVLPNDYVEMNMNTLDFEVVNRTDLPDHLLVHACCKAADSSTKLRLPFSKSFRLLNMAYKKCPTVEGMTSHEEKYWYGPENTAALFDSVYAAGYNGQPYGLLLNECHYTPGDCEPDATQAYHYNADYSQEISSSIIKLSTTISGKTCQSWTSESPNAHSYSADSWFPDDGGAEAAANYCRPVDYGEFWCYTTDPSTRWEVCDVQLKPYCGGQPFTNSQAYAGTVWWSYTSKSCLQWAQFSQYDDADFPDGSKAAAANFCRSPDGGKQPWCFVGADGSTERCQVPYEDTSDCVYRDASGDWHDDLCTATYPVVCNVPTVEVAIVCVDQDGGCEDNFAAHPNLCTDNTMWSIDRCAKTCGVCLDGSPDTCSSPGPVTLATVVTTTTSFEAGSYVEYKCDVGYHLSSGNLLRGCTYSSTWTGSPPVCSADIALWSSMLSMQDRSDITDSRVLYLSDNPSSRVPKNGKVVGWRYFTTTSGVLVAQIWRRSDPSLNFFHIVGQTVISPSGDQTAGYLELEAPDQFDVQAGDCVGFLFLSSNTLGGIPFDGCSTEYMQDADLNYYNSDFEWALDENSASTWVSKWRGVNAPYDKLDSPELGIEFNQRHTDTKDC